MTRRVTRILDALTEHVAVAIGAGDGGIDTRHVVYEAAAVRGIVVMRAPEQYMGHRVPLLVV
ncbi:MAG TPA: hypothetical protein VFM55_07180 [Micromonosporaceae bacterium]|nr:hypothetical protein [Micromonosporaceae bacterium]